MKPRLGRTVYCVWDNGILVEKVYAISKISFIVESFSDMTVPDTWEWYFEDYNEIWFTSLAKAKRQLKENFKGCTAGKIVKINENYYEIEY